MRAADAMIEKVQLDRVRRPAAGAPVRRQQQRVALARAAITQPRVLLLDEPLSALDEQLRVQMRQELRRMQRELGITFIHVTHTQLEAIALADLVVVMEQGQIQQAASAREVYAKPHDRYVAEFLGGQNVLSGKVETGQRRNLPARRRCAQGSIEVPLQARPSVSVGDRVDVAVRRDDVELIRAGQSASRPGAPSAIASRVLAIEYQGDFREGHARRGAARSEFVAYVPERTFFQDPLNVGDPVLATWAVEVACRLLWLDPNLGNGVQIVQISLYAQWQADRRSTSSRRLLLTELLARALST